MFLLFEKLEYYYGYDNKRLIGVFSTKENAEKHVQDNITFDREDYFIEEWAVDSVQ